MMPKAVYVFLIVSIVAFLATAAWASDDHLPATPEAEVSAPQAEAASAEAPLCHGDGPEAALVADFEQIFKSGGEPCGGVICGPFEYCCNPTCNACVLYGMSCTQEVCN